MIKRILFVSLFLVLVASSSNALWGGDFETGFNIDQLSLTLKDSADNIYIGGDTTASGFGFGGHANMFYKINDNFSWGPDFNFTYHSITGTWYTFNIFQPSLGGALKWDFGPSSLTFFLDYNLGWVGTEGETTTSGAIAAAGAFASNIRGFMLGIRSRTGPVGLYTIVGAPSLMAFKYNRLDTTTTPNSYDARWVNLDVSIIQFGANFYVDQFLPGTKK